ncbi:MAG: hypothetical protein SFV18_17280 [Bryobacteraceae bacterium]|nr:hypothetical protein [Bryobacteraceae bacterium]
MSLLHDIQSAVIGPVADLGSILLKVRLLAAKLGSQPLADWVNHESEGYPDDCPVPDYRVIPITYTANFSGPLGSGINNAPIPPVLVQRLAGEQWTRHSMRQSVAAVDQLLASLDKGEGTLGIDSSNLILLFQGKLYPQYTCLAVYGSVPASALAELRHSVKSRVLQLTIEFEKSIPEAISITIGNPVTTSTASSGAATQIAQQIIYGNVTSISASGEACVSIGIQAGDGSSVIQYLSAKGIPADDAKEFAAIVGSEKPESLDEPFGKKARTWLVENLKKAVAGTWNVGVAVATDVLKEAAIKYYGLK